MTSAESSLSTAQTNLNDASLTSTICGHGGLGRPDRRPAGHRDGLGGAGSAGNGERLAPASSGCQRDSGASGSARPAQSSGQIVVIGTDSYIVNTTVDDTQIGQIADGDQVDITPSRRRPRRSTARSAPSASSAASQLRRDDVPRGDRRDREPVRPLRRRERRRQHHRQAAQQRDRGARRQQSRTAPSGQATVTEVVNGSHVVKDVTVGAAENGETQIMSGVQRRGQGPRASRSPSRRRAAAAAASSRWHRARAGGSRRRRRRGVSAGGGGGGFPAAGPAAGAGG